MTNEFRISVPAPPCVLALALALFGGCSSHQPPRFEPQAVAPAEHAALRDRVRGYAKTHCGTCHQSSLPTSRSAALAIYDLDSDAWASMLTVARLQNGFPRRLNAQLDDSARQQLRAFIQSELALRAK